jgi:hypothetical protein
MTKIQSVRSRILKVRSAILELIFCQFCFNLWPKLWSVILKLRTVIIDDWSANLCFESGYWLELRGFTLFHPRHLSTDWKTDPKQKRRGRTQLKKNLKKNLKKENLRTGREIVDLLGVLFSLLFFHVVLLFKHKSLYNLWHDLCLDTLLGV